MSPTAAWLVLIVGFVLPLLHVGLSPASGPWRADGGSRCPFSPKIGWLVLVLFLGPVGWLLFMARRRRPSAAKGPTV